MKITHIISETTTSGSVATVAAPLFKQSRKGGNLLTGMKTKKKYANSLSEGKMKELATDLSTGKDGLTDEEFQKKYNKTKEEMRKSLESKPEQVKEAELQEDDLIIVPGQGRKLKTGFIPHSQDRTDHEVEMALSDLYHAAKNAKQLHDIVSSISEEQGLEGWVQEKIIKAADYLNTVREYLEHKQAMSEQHLGGVIGSGFAGESNDHQVEGGPMTKAMDVLSTILNAASQGESTSVVIGGVKGPVPVKHAINISNMYKQASAEGRGEDFIRIFTDPKSFLRLVKHPEFLKRLSKVVVQNKPSPEGLRGTAMYDYIAKNTGDDVKPTSSIKVIGEKAVSKAQQKFMGMVHAAQKGEKPASSEVAKVAKTMTKKAAKDFAQTKHKDLPEKVKKDKE